MAQKLYVIDDPSVRESRDTSPIVTPPRELPFRAPPASPRADTAAGRAGLRLLAAYLVGPFAVAGRTTGRTRRAWTWAGIASVSAAAMLSLGWPSFGAWAGTAAGGVVAWMIAVSVVPIGFFAVWSRAIAATANRQPVRLHERLRRRSVVLALGTVVPGLGFHIAGRPKRAAATFALVGPLLAAAFILRHWRWLLDVGQPGSAATIGANAMEIILMATAATGSALLLLWISSALGAARLITPDRRRAHAGPVALLFLVATTLLIGTQMGVPLAGRLHDASTALREDGLRLIPLGLCQVAAHLDPSRPVYLVDVAALNDSLGRSAEARWARLTLADRSTGFQAAVRLASRSRAGFGHRGSERAWLRIQALSIGRSAYFESGAASSPWRGRAPSLQDLTT